MDIQVIKPFNEDLRKYIECFYIIRHSKKNKKTTYFTFPTTNTIVTISNAKVITTKTSIKATQSAIPNFISELDVKFTNPILVEYKGNIKEITTYFKPLGLNRFLTKPLQYYSNQKQFIPFPDYTDTMQAILNIESDNAMIEQFEKYWLSKLNTYLHFKLDPIIEDMLLNPSESISSISEKHQLSHKTLIAHFNKDICKTPSQFRKIVRFRKALNTKDSSLTQLSYACNYFDQAHMIKDFQKLTGYQPKNFFKNLRRIEGVVNWIFLNG